MISVYILKCIGLTCSGNLFLCIFGEMVSAWLPLKHGLFTFNYRKSRPLITLSHKAEFIICKRLQLWSWHFFYINEIAAGDEVQMASYAKQKFNYEGKL